MNGSYLRKSNFDKKENIQINHFEIRLNEHPKTVFVETHKQRIRSLQEVVDFIEASLFTLIAGFKDFTFQPFDESCERVHFVLQKKS